jgi:uncharacterized damage-inducible protein DinB
VALGREDAELREKLHHLHTVQWGYLHIWRGELVKPPELAAFATSEALQAWAREYYRELLLYLPTVHEGDLRRDVRFPWADHSVKRFGRAEAASWAESVLQVAMHSSYHRGQAARRLRELGVDPPLTDFIAWIWMKRPGADWGGGEAA